MRLSLTIVFLIALTICIFTYQSPAQAQTAETTQNSSQVELETVLTKLGYATVPLERMKSGHLVAAVQINGSKNLRFICDSGSGGTLITPETCKSLKLKSSETAGSASGVGGVGLGVSLAKLESFQIGGIKHDVSEILVIDISHVNKQFKALGEKQVQGIIGSDWMMRHHALLDVASKRMYFKNKTPNSESAGK